MKIGHTLAPVGYRMDLTGLLRAWAEGSRARQDRVEALQPEFAHSLRVRTALAVSSGKAALTLALLAMNRLTGRRTVVIPAYTCYSVPSAIVKAGLEVMPCDLADGSFDYDYAKLEAALSEDVLCVLSVHLFGIPSDTARLTRLCRSKAIFVLEDAAQAFGGGWRGVPLGTIGDVGVFSFGRGKNISCGSGGMIVTNSKALTAALAEVTRLLPAASPTQDGATLLTLVFLSWFIRPRLYWLPSGLPFLRLGETIFYEDFPVRWLSDFQARLLRGWRDRLAALEAVRREHSDYYRSHIELPSGFRHVDAAGDERGTIPLLRYPLLLDRDVKNHLLREEGRVLGISGMYPATVAAIPQLAGRLPATHFPRAEALAASLVTLPTHPLVREDDRARICALVGRELLRMRGARLAS